MSVPIGAAITVTSVTQSGPTITVNGTGFSTETVITLFNRRGAATVNLSGLGSGGAVKTPLTVVDSTKFTFTTPAGAVAGAAYVQAINPRSFLIPVRPATRAALSLWINDRSRVCAKPC